MDRFAQMILAAARQAETDSGLDIAKESRSRRRLDRDRDRRARRFPGLLRDADRARPGPRQPVLDPRDHPEHGRGLGLDGARDARAALVAVHRLRRLEHGDRRGRRRDPARPRRRDDLRRHRGRDHARRDRRLRRDARALASERRSEARLASVRRRARRLRDGRGGRRRRARGARACAGARREDLRRADRLRPLLGREPHHRARPLGREPRPGDDDGVRATRASTRRRSATSTRTALRRPSATSPRPA